MNSQAKLYPVLKFYVRNGPPLPPLQASRHLNNTALLESWPTEGDMLRGAAGPMRVHMLGPEATGMCGCNCRE